VQAADKVVRAAQSVPAVDQTTRFAVVGETDRSTLCIAEERKAGDTQLNSSNPVGAAPDPLGHAEVDDATNCKLVEQLEHHTSRILGYLALEAPMIQRKGCS
jgi:hypothetical protein